MYVSRGLRRARSTRPAGVVPRPTTIEVFTGVMLPSSMFPSATNNPPPPAYNYVPPPYPAWLPNAALAVGAAGAGWLLLSLVNRRK